MASPGKAGGALRRLARRGAASVERPVRRLVRIEPSRLLDAARRRTGLDDFGDAAFFEPLRRLLGSLEDEARLTLLGRIAVRTDLTQMLVNRLTLERDRRRHAEIAGQEIRRPLFITGLPRSGSTFLHGLLAEDPATRVPLHWETREPSPPTTSAREIERRIARAERQIRWFYRLAPDFQRIHPVAARMPEECVVILSHSFLSYQFSSTWFVPSYQSWLEQQDLGPAYRFHRRFLQHLQWQRPAERWVLKAPPHLPGLDALFATYPDAGVIMTHRDPLDVVASVSSLHFVLRRTFCEGVERLQVGPEVSDMLADDIRRGLASRDAGSVPERSFFDLRYAELLEDPIASVRAIYRHFDLELTGALEQRMLRHAAASPKDRDGTHEYSLEQYGLDPLVERERYDAYRERFGV